MSVSRIKRLILMPLIGLIFALSTLFTPLFTTSVHADPTDNVGTLEEDPESTPNSSDSSSNEDSEPAEPTGEREGASSVTTDASDPSRNGDTPESSDTSTSCTDQVGAIGWLVCPTTGFLANAIDALYDAIEGLLVVEPLSSNTDSPIFIVWNYARNISNIVFVILLLVIIYSQITGLGINNYGIKRTLPRIIVAAILVNLSFLIASVAVDISNIFGASLRDFLANVGESAIASGTVNPEVNINVADVFAAVATGGSILGVSVAVAGGFSALLALLIPVIVGGVISVAVGLFTISLRQSVISLLVMISPLAFVAYLLPNTEKYFEKWLKVFMQMIIFYPMFSLLFGASRLAGWVLITSADNGLGIILGIAVQIFPLITGVSLMKMSNTVLSSISNRLSNIGSHATNASRSYANEIRANRRANYIANNPNRFNLPRRAAQSLQGRRYRRAMDTAELQKRIEEHNKAYTASTYFKSNGEVSRRGLRHADNVNAMMDYQRTVLRSENHFDEGLAQFSKAGTKRYKQAEKRDQAAVRASDRLKYEQARSVDINLENLQGYADRTNKAISDQLRDGIESSRYRDIRATAGSRGQEGINAILSNALSSRTRVRNEVTSDYITLFEETPLTAEIDDYLARSMGKDGAEMDENIMSAAIQVMMQRGDTDLVAKKLAEGTPNFSGNSPRDIAMQKRLSDTLLRYKSDSVALWAYAKSLNMARGKAENARREGAPINPSFFEFEDFLDSQHGEAKQWGLDIDTLISTADESVLGTQDRTFYGYGKSLDRLFGTETQRRNVLFGGVQVTGEKLSSVIDMHLGKGASWGSTAAGFESAKADRKVLTFADEAALEKARQNISAMLKGNNAAHFGKFKAAELDAFATIMSEDALSKQADGSIIVDLRDSDHRDEMVVRGLKQLIADGIIVPDEISGDLHKLYTRGALQGMNPKTRELLDRVFHFQ